MRQSKRELQRKRPTCRRGESLTIRYTIGYDLEMMDTMGPAGSIDVFFLIFFAAATLMLRRDVT